MGIKTVALPEFVKTLTGRYAEREEKKAIFMDEADTVSTISDLASRCKGMTLYAYCGPLEVYPGPDGSYRAVTTFGKDDFQAKFELEDLKKLNPIRAKYAV